MRRLKQNIEALLKQGATRLTAISLSAVLVLTCFTACGESNPAGQASGSGTESSAQAGNTSEAGGTGTEQSGADTNAGNAGSGNLAIDEAFNDDDGFESVWAGTQFYNGEEVVILRRENGSEDAKTGQNIYLKDSKGISMRIVSGVPKDYKGTWFYTYQGYCLAFFENQLLRIEADGSEKFNLTVENGVKDIVQLEDGTIVLLMRDMDGVYRLAVLDPEEATFTKIPGEGFAKDKRVYISADGNKVVLLNRDGFFDVNLETGELASRMPIGEYDYTVAYNVKAFRMLGGGSVRMLYQNSNEVLFPVDLEKYKTIVELLGPDEEWLKEWLNCFNRHSEQYYAVLVPFESAGSDEASEKKLYAALESDEGADVVYGGCFTNRATAMASGYLESLSPYMKRDGVYEEDYFPGTFDDFKENGEIYGVYTAITVGSWAFSEDVLGGRNVLGMEELVNALIGYTEPAQMHGAAGNLKYFLSASESLAGAVDWENLTCDFHHNLFVDILEVSKLFAYARESGFPEVAGGKGFSGFYYYTNEEQLSLSRMVQVGYLFDDGEYPASVGLNPFYINQKSSDKEGAWALLKFLLSEEFQIQNDIYTTRKIWVSKEDTDRIPQMIRFVPVNVYAFDTVVEMEIEESAIVEFVRPDWTIKVYKAGEGSDKLLGDEGYRGLHNLTESDAAEMLEMLYRARPLPTKTLDLQAIIYEEAALYFGGQRELGDTCDAIQKRAQEYLDSLK